jgi:putative transposase
LKGDEKMKVYKSYIIPLKNNTSEEDISYLFECNRESAKVWNECNKLSKDMWKKENAFPDRDNLQKYFKGFSNILPACCIQVTIKKYLGAIQGSYKARKVGRTDIKYPWKEKKNYNTIWKGQNVRIKNNYILLCKPRDTINKKLQNPVKIYSAFIPYNICYAEILYDNGLKLALNYWIDSEDYEQIESNNISAIDLGEIHTITSVDNLGNTQIITGRRLRSFQRFRNKELGKIQKKLRKCKKGSRNYKKYRKAIIKIMSKSNAKITNELHKTSKLYIDYSVKHKIKNVIIGDLGKFNMNLKSNKGGGKLQKLVQWNHGQLINMLIYKLARHNINVEEISERYTSQTCPNCGHKYKPSGRNYICSECGFELHRDVLGAYNILSKYLNDGVIKHMDLELKPLKYLRIV